MSKNVEGYSDISHTQEVTDISSAKFSRSCSIKLPLAFRLHIIDVVYNLERGVLKIRWLKQKVKIYKQETG